MIWMMYFPFRGKVLCIHPSILLLAFLAGLNRFLNQRRKNQWSITPPSLSLSLLCCFSLFQTLMNVRQTLITVTPPRSASTQQGATPVPALKATGSLVDSARVSEHLHSIRHMWRGGLSWTFSVFVTSAHPPQGEQRPLLGYLFTATDSTQYVHALICLFLSDQILMNVAMVTANSCVPMSLALIPAPVTLVSSSTQTAGPVKVRARSHSARPAHVNMCTYMCPACRFYTSLTHKRTSVVLNRHSLLFLQMWMSVKMNRAVTAASTPTAPSCATVTRDLSWHPTELPALVRRAGWGFFSIILHLMT